MTHFAQLIHQFMGNHLSVLFNVKKMYIIIWFHDVLISFLIILFSLELHLYCCMGTFVTVKF